MQNLFEPRYMRHYEQWSKIGWGGGGFLSPSKTEGIQLLLSSICSQGAGYFELQNCCSRADQVAPAGPEAESASSRKVPVQLLLLCLLKCCLTNIMLTAVLSKRKIIGCMYSSLINKIIAKRL